MVVAVKYPAVRLGVPVAVRMLLLLQLANVPVTPVPLTELAPAVAEIVIGEAPMIVKGVHEASPVHDTVVVATEPKRDGKPAEVQYGSCPMVGVVEVDIVPEPEPPVTAAQVETEPLVCK